MSLLPLPLLILPLAFAGQALWRWRSLRLPSVRRQGRVTLILPLTGPAPGLEALLAALAAQTLQPRRLVIGIESAADPAYARVIALAPRCAYPVEIRLAGQVAWRGQKNTNLLAALAAVDAADDAVVLFDGDIRPPPWWLSAAASPALDGTHEVITGFRWQLLQGRGPIGQLVAWLDRTAAVLVLPPRWGMVWGGTIGLSRRALAVLDLPRLLDRALVDDFTIGGAARRARLRLLSRGALTVPTPAEGDARAQLRFLRRQLQLVRICQPAGWLALIGTMHLFVLGWVLAVLALPEATGLLALLVFAASGVVRAVAEAGIAARIGAPDPPSGRLAQVLIGALSPLPEAVAAALGWTMLRTRRMRWRHVEYEVRGPFRVRVLARHAG